MKFIRVLFSVVAFIFLTAVIGLETSGNSHLLKAVSNTYFVGLTGPSIDEYAIFESREIETGDQIPLKFAEGYNSVIADEKLIKDIEQYNPAALLILQNGKILFDKYWGDYSNKSLTNSFSMAKSFVGLSIGRCLDLNLIDNLNEKVINIIPELKGTFREEVTIKHLMDMTSGINYDESYGNPFGFMAKAYYGEKLLETTLQYSAEKEPGTEWKYSGGNTILMSVIVERVSGQSLSDFVSTHFWKPLGAAQPALWSLDKEAGIEKAYCCFYSNAEDFSRIGQMILDSGKINGQEVLSQEFINQMWAPLNLKDNSNIPHYGMQWWKIQYKSKNIIYARGILGQFIIAIPELNVVVVRLGHKRGEKDELNQPADLYHYIDLAYQLTSQ